MEEIQLTSCDDVREHIFRAIQKSVKLATGGWDGDGVHIGIIDSVHKPPNQIYSNYDVVNTDSFIDEPSDDFDIPHGVQIFETISKIVPKASFSFYQVMGESDKTGIAPVTKAIDCAREHEVDIINLSLGRPNEIPPKSSAYYRPIKRALDDDIIPVAAAGNKKQKKGPRRYVFGPANIEQVIAVGGFETICPQPSVESKNQSMRGPYQYKNDPKERSFCGFEGCSSGESCDRNRQTRPWPDNPDPLDGKPDVLAPTQFPGHAHEGYYSTGGPDDVTYYEGTSFAAPVVTGTLAWILDELNADPGEIIEHARSSLRQSGDPIDDYDAPRLNAFNTYQQIEGQLEKEHDDMADRSQPT